jgi:hypothetical protein
MKILDQINADLESLAGMYATGNAHGIPVNNAGSVRVTRTDILVFDHKTPVQLNQHTAHFLRELADIVEKFY